MLFSSCLLDQVFCREPYRVISIGVLFSELSAAGESPMVERIWPFFLALFFLLLLAGAFLAFRRPKDPPDDNSAE